MFSKNRFRVHPSRVARVALKPSPRRPRPAVAMPGYGVLLQFADPQQRAQALASRRVYQRQLYQEASAAVDHAEDEPPPGCFGRLWRGCRPGQRPLLDARARESLSGLRQTQLAELAQLATVQAPADAQAHQPAARAQASASRAQGSWGAALFGRKSVKVGADQQLAAALESIEARMQQSEQRAVELRAQALKARRGGMRSAALRSLKLSKAAEEKVARLGNLAVAIERQRDSLEDVGLQQNVASALGAGVQGMRKAQAALKGVEKVADDTIEMRDVAEDLASALQQVGETAFEGMDLDDEDLLAELDAHEEPEPAAQTGLPVASQSAQLPSVPDAQFESEAQAQHGLASASLPGVS